MTFKEWKDWAERQHIIPQKFNMFRQFFAMKSSAAEGYLLVVGYGLGTAITVMRRKPYYADQHIAISLAVLGYFIGHAWDQIKFESLKQRELVIDDYVQAHPDLFTEHPPRQFKDILGEWIPVRNR